MQVTINGKIYTYRFIGENIIKPEKELLGISENDILECNYYKSSYAKYQQKKENIIFFISLILSTAICSYLFFNNFHIKHPINIERLIAYIVFGIIVFGFILNFIFYFLIYGILEIIIPDKVLDFISSLILPNIPIKPDSFVKVANFEKQCEEFEKRKYEYSKKYIGISDFDYNLLEYGKICINDMVNNIISFTNYQNSLITKDNRRKEQDYWFNLDPYEFESEVAYWFTKKGYNSKVTKRSGDKGIDIIISKDDYTGYVQCKRYRTSKVDYPTLTSLYGVVSADNVNEGIIVCLKGLSKEAIEFASKVGIKVITVDDLAPTENLIHHMTHIKSLDIQPNQVNDCWCEIGNLKLKSFCYRTQNDIDNFIEKESRNEMYHSITYKGLYLCIYCSEDNFKEFDKWLKFITPQEYISTKYSQGNNYKKTKKKRNWRNRYWKRRY